MTELEQVTMQRSSSGYWFMPDTLSEYIEECVQAPKGYLMGILITSGTQGREEAMGLDFGLGKSTLLGQLGKMMCQRWDHLIPDGIVDPLVFKQLDLGSRPIRRAWEKSKRFWMYFPWEIFNLFDFNFRALCGLYDDFNVTLGKSKSNSPRIRDLADDMKNKRTHLAVFFASASHIDDIAAPFRGFFKFELIIPVRGIFEIQLNKQYKNYWDPEKDSKKMRYKGTTTFESFPGHFQSWYDTWREMKLQRNKNVTRMKILDLFSKDYDVDDLIEKYAKTLPAGKHTPGNLPVSKDRGSFGEIEKAVLQMAYMNEGVTVYELQKISKRHLRIGIKLQKMKLLEKFGQGSKTFFITESGREAARDLKLEMEEEILEI